jgi:hypothetical protein
MAHANIGRPFGAGRRRPARERRIQRLVEPRTSIAAHGLERCTLGTRAFEGRRCSNVYWTSSEIERRKNSHGQ